MAEQGKPTVLQELKGLPLKLLVAPDSFKGTFTSGQVAAAIARGARQAGMEAQELAVADGGEGTLEALTGPLGLERRSVSVSDSLGRPMNAQFGVAASGIAVVETAAASGLNLVAPVDRDPVGASTYGTGQLICAAIEAGAQRVYVAVGGSGTSDGGEGALRALAQIDPERVNAAKITVLCDVKTPFELAGEIYGPQKGAGQQQVDAITERLNRQAAAFARDPRGVPMTGAAGGLAGGLWAKFGAQLVSGASFLLDAVGYDALMHNALAVVTGEGRLDRQSLVGKLISEVATRARQSGVPCHAVVGSRALDAFDARILDLQLILEASTESEMEAAGQQIAQTIQSDRARGR